MVQSPELRASDTPCPIPIGRLTRSIRLGRFEPIDVGQAHAMTSPARTLDLLAGQDGRGYAVPDELREDPEKRKRQKEAFSGVTPITGRGPCSYYTNSQWYPALGGWSIRS